MKKKLLALLIIGSAVVGSSCKKLAEATDQNVTLTSADVTLEITSKEASPATEVELKSATSSSELDALIKKHNSSFGISNIKSLKIKTLTAEIVSKTDNSDSFAKLQDIKSVVSGAGKTFTATYTGTPSAQTSKINLTVDSSVDLKDIISSSSITYSLKSKILSKINGNVTVKLSATYDAVVGF